MKTIALTTIPMSSTVKDVLESGLLEQRLQEGLERIYISTYTFHVHPEIEGPLRKMEARYLDRLIINDDPIDKDFVEIMTKSFAINPEVDDALACAEYIAIGSQLYHRYLSDFGMAKDFYNPPPRHPDFPDLRFLIGIPPEGLPFLLSREDIVPVEEWSGLNEFDMHRRIRDCKVEIQKQDEEAVELLKEVIKPRKP